MKQLIPLIIAASSMLSFSSCSTLQNVGNTVKSFFGTGIPSTTQVTADTALVVAATREAVLLLGPSNEATLNAYILLVHNTLATLSAGIAAGQSLMPTPDQVQAYLTNIAVQYGSPVWMMNFIGNLKVEYTKFYNSITKDEATTVAYLNAFVTGTV